MFEVVFPILFSRRRQLRVREEVPDGAIHWVLSGAEGGRWTLLFAGGELRVLSGSRRDATAVLSASVDHWRALWCGELQPQTALMTGRVKVVGNMSYIINHPCVMPC
jgi:putative sterol carrier protein